MAENSDQRRLKIAKEIAESPHVAAGETRNKGKRVSTYIKALEAGSRPEAKKAIKPILQGLTLRVD